MSGRACPSISAGRRVSQSAPGPQTVLWVGSAAARHQEHDGRAASQPARPQFPQPKAAAVA